MTDASTSSQIVLKKLPWNKSRIRARSAPGLHDGWMAAAEPDPHALHNTGGLSLLGPRQAWLGRNKATSRVGP
jgi:hypothetical protein